MPITGLLIANILVKDEDEAVDVARKYLSCFQGPVGTQPQWTCPRCCSDWLPWFGAAEYLTSAMLCAVELTS